MRIKSYFAETVQEAMEKARVELGPEAMLVTSKKVDAELRHLGTYEVVFGLTHENAAVSKSVAAKLTNMPVPAAAPVSAAPAPKPKDDLAQELADLRKQIETVTRSVSRQQFQTRWQGPQGSLDMQELYGQLISADFSEEMSQELLEAVEARVQGDWRSFSMQGRGGREVVNPEMLENALQEEIDERLA